MRLPILLPIAVLITTVGLTSCSSTEDLNIKYPYPYMLSNTECLSNINTEYTQNKTDDNNGIFEIILDGSTARCRFISLEYPCDFGKVNINIIYNDGVLTIVEYPSSDKADCHCEIDAMFSILNMPDKDFILKIYHGDITGSYNKKSPQYEGKITINNHAITIPYRI